ncbi:MAG TPA: kinase [Pseudonocardiaceae bacterium]|jgi:guanylate kinase|nr:kinase [Pseudonocardiaceae bacterium]
MSRAVILYGPPASGKDTITRELLSIGGFYEHFQRLKVGGDSKSGYRSAGKEMLATLQCCGEILYANDRYGATYGIDRTGLDEITKRGRIPVVHLGQVAGVMAVTGNYAASWLVIGLWCSREVAADRLMDRGDTRFTERMAAWDATLTDLRTSDPGIFALTINTGAIGAASAAKLIDSCCRAS